MIGCIALLYINFFNKQIDVSYFTRFGVLGQLARRKDLARDLVILIRSWVVLYSEIILCSSKKLNRLRNKSVSNFAFRIVVFMGNFLTSVVQNFPKREVEYTLLLG